jgi:hypothetical protein
MTILPEEGSFATRFGQKLGAGLSEQLPKEMERFRTRAAIESLANQPVETDPLKQFAKLAAVPGLTPEMMTQLAPLIRSRAILAQRNQQMGKPQLQQGQRPQGQQGQLGAEPSRSTAMRPAAERQATRLIGTPEALEDRAYQLMSQQPLLYPDYDTALAKAQREVASQKTQISSVRSELGNSLGKKIQASGEATYSSVLGSFQDRLAEMAEQDVLSGKMTEEEAGRKYSEMGKELALARNKLGEFSGVGLFTGPGRGAKKQSLGEISKIYSKFGLNEEFKDELISKLGVSEGAASFLAQSSPEKSAAMQAVKKASSPLQKIKGVFSPEKIAGEIAKNLKPTDSLHGITFYADRKGLDAESLFSNLSKLYNDGKLQLTKAQQRELQSAPRFTPNLNDFYLFSFGGVGI